MEPVKVAAVQAAPVSNAPARDETAAGDGILVDPGWLEAHLIPRTAPTEHARCSGGSAMPQVGGLPINRIGARGRRGGRGGR